MILGRNDLDFELYPREEVYVPPTGMKVDEKEGLYEFPPARGSVLRNAMLLGPAAVGFVGDDIILDTAYSGRLDVLERNFPYMKMAEASRYFAPDTLIEKAVSMVGVWSGNYFHWFTEFLPRIRFVPSEYIVIVEDNPQPWQIESLEILGREYVIRGTRKTLVYELFVPSFRRSDGRTPPSDMAWLRKAFGVSPSPKKDLFISRKDAKDRRVLNEPRNAIALTGKTLREQIDLFGGARTITAPHGAGLTNMIWSDAEITELFGNYVNPCYNTLAAACGLKYDCIMCEPKNGDMIL